MRKKLSKIMIIFGLLMMVSILMWNDTKIVSAKTVKAGWVEQKDGIKYVQPLNI
jgi:hypothetical protein